MLGECPSVEVITFYCQIKGLKGIGDSVSSLQETSELPGLLHREQLTGLVDKIPWKREISW